MTWNLIDMSKDIDDNPRLLLCDSCQSEYLVPSWIQYKTRNPSGPLRIQSVNLI